jgi:hypothetical protein
VIEKDELLYTPLAAPAHVSSWHFSAVGH